ncbi:hypothetical protein A9Q99_00425 [Gammaproteobacteria bacterium 45_16_T64]|nr:hypothetical protein A9Q99_00425 [Gammaproteobacteria bacterium 45_16_T64]
MARLTMLTPIKCRHLLYLAILILIAPTISQAKILQKSKYYKQTLKVKGVERSYYVYLPKGIDLAKKHPAVIAFHGFESDANGFKWLIEPESFSENFQYVMIFPNAIKKSWNIGKGYGSTNKSVDDISFVKNLINVVTARHPINKKKIYAMGFSNGAQMAALSYCQFGSQIAAVGMVSHTLNLSSCNPKYRTPIAIINGQKDKYVPFSGGGKFKLRSHKKSVEFFKKNNVVGDVEKTLVSKKNTLCKNYSDNGNTSNVISCALFNSGHSWPGGKEFKIKQFGKVNRDINATKLLFSFFKKNALPNPKKTHVATKVIKRQPVKPAGFVDLSKHIYKRGKNKSIYYSQKRKSNSKKKGSIVIMFSSKQHTSNDIASIFKTKLNIDKYGLMFVYPKVTVKDVTQQFDEGFLYEIKDKFKDFANRVFVVGFSHGGNHAQRYYCEYSYLLTAVATASYGWNNGNCEPVVKRPVLVMLSKKDPIYPYRGNSKTGQLGFRDTIAILKSDIDPMITKNNYINGKDHRCGAWKDVSTLQTVVECSTDWGGHNLAGSPFRFPKKNGPHVKHFDASKAIFGFLNNQKHYEFSIIHER